MTVEEFVEEYTWRRAREMQAEMLAQSSRRPKSWTFESGGDGSRKTTIYFDGCPCRLKSAGMVAWLRALLLWNEAMDDDSIHGFSAHERFKMCCASVDAQMDGNLWVFEPYGLPQGLCKLAVESGCYEEGMEVFADLRAWFVAKCHNEDLPDHIYWSCVDGLLLCCIYMIEIELKTGEISEASFVAIKQLAYFLDECVADAEENDCAADFSVGGDSFERFTKLIPKIEETGNQELIRAAYELARDYYQASRRFTLAERFSQKLM